MANDDGSQITNVTVTRIQGKTANGYDTMIYHITIDSDQPVSIGNTPIVFGNCSVDFLAVLGLAMASLTGFAVKKRRHNK